MEAVAVDVFVLNFNGGALLTECLPSIVSAVAASRHTCRIVVVDNASTDDSVALLRRNFPSVSIRHMPNRGLCSFNQVVSESNCRVVLLLNNDVKAEYDAFDPLIEPLLPPHVEPELETQDDEPIAMTAPRSTLFDGTTHEGFKTSVRWRYGLVQATSHFDGAEQSATIAGPTASVGAAMAVDRATFVALGGFDSVYLPGRIEDLDFAYRLFQSGKRAVYVPTSRFQHRGAATFGKTFGQAGCDNLALRNTLLFQWRRLRLPQYYARQLLWLPLRAVRDVVQAPFLPAAERFAFCRAFVAAYQIHRSNIREAQAIFSPQREREFFARHSPAKLATAVDDSKSRIDPILAEEAARDVNYPVSRWLLRPAARAVAKQLAKHAVHPTYVTMAGLACAIIAAVALVAWPQSSWIAALFIFASWFCDRTDGPLSRLQGSSGPLGAWIDANVDECVDLGLHVATAGVAAQLSGSSKPWFWLIAFLVGKYLLMHGLASDDDLTAESELSTAERRSVYQKLPWWKTLYHLPSNADVRAHLLIVAVASGYLTLELAIVAIYYNLRWPVRYVLLARRFRTVAAGATT